jgi:hopanoid biosynthesis associated RND transporter like protein HpnN
MARLVALCVDHPRLIAILALALALAALSFTLTHFSLSSDTQGLISPKLAWRQRELAFDRLFQTEGDQIVVVIDAATPELAQEAAAAIAANLEGRSDLFRHVDRPDGGPFFAREGLLFEPLPDVQAQMSDLVAGQPFLGPLAADPSLRGLAGVLTTAVQGANAGQAKLSDLARPIGALGGALDALRTGRPTYFSWRTLISGKPPAPRETRQIVLASPVLNFTRLLSGADAIDYVRKAARDMRLDPAHGVRVRLTGPVPLQDEEFATLGDRAGLIASLAAAAILVMLWLAVRSVRLIGAIVFTTLLGLVCAAAAGLLVFRTFNVISVAFIPLFVGLGIDFGIQFSVRFRSEHRPGASLRSALIASGEGMGRSLTLAAAAIASGFLAFAPTAYVGVSQLGIIAGLGMVIALILNLSVLPALIDLLAPKPATRLGGGLDLERLDGLILGHRRVVVGTALAAAALCATTLPFLHFDFNTLHLKSPRTESVATLLDLMRDPDQATNTMEVVAPNLGAAQAMAARLAQAPQVAEARTAMSFVPADQAPKLAAIGDAAQLLDLTLDPIVVAPPPSDAEAAAALRTAAAQLRIAAAAEPNAGASALRLAEDFDWLAGAGPGARQQADRTLMTPLKTVLDETRLALQAQSVSLADLPATLTRDWIAPDGRARVSAAPKGDANDDRVLARFIAAVLRVAPDATGTAFDVQQGGKTVSGAFAEAGALSFVVITLLLFLVLRRLRDVAITMAPIVLTGLLTLGTCVAIGQPLNFANIIALPLLFGIGVAFHIYFVMAWRSGGSHLLQSSLTRAVFFSALATATGFGSLWASRHPGTASMGKLLMISLVWTLVSALIFQPALMGPPPSDTAEGREKAKV